MNYQLERAREIRKSAQDTLIGRFPGTLLSGCIDAEWLSASCEHVIGAAGLAYKAPVCEQIINEPTIFSLLSKKTDTDHLFIFEANNVRHFTPTQEVPLGPESVSALLNLYDLILESRGSLSSSGEHLINLKSAPVGPHYAVNLLIGDRTEFPSPLFTTPKSALDAFGAGSFRAGGASQVLATRFTLSPEENGEPANRQFYLVEDGKMIFYSMNARKNVQSAFCRHSRNYSVITYITECGLYIERTIFILPQEEGMPDAVELQHISVLNGSSRARNLKIVLTGMFSLCTPITTVNDVVFANIVHESEVAYDGDRPVAVGLHSKPANFSSEKRFALILSEGETMDDFCMSLPAFIGSGTLSEPAMLERLPSRLERKMAPFFAMGKSFSLLPGQKRDIDSFACMTISYDGTDAGDRYDAELKKLTNRYSDPLAAEKALERIKATQESLCSYLEVQTGDADFDAYVNNTLPFQVYYQTFVSRSFAWTQKAYRETGFREIQDLYASMYYLASAGKSALVRNLISMWAQNVFRMGYANHDFTWVGKEPGDCSDDQLWLVQAVYYYVKLTGDYGFLNEELPVAEGDGFRSLWETMMAILTYSGCISVGAHGLPLLDKADWNDTLRLDRTCMKGPEKETLYRKQLETSGKPWGSPLENSLSESCMNACLLIIAANEIVELSKETGREADGQNALEISSRVEKSMQENAWKGDYFARALINDNREGGYTCLGTHGDGLSADPAIDGSFFLNSFSWAILSGIASEEQITLMLENVERYLKTDAGLKLCTLIQFELLGANTATSLYFPGDRENGAVFKHAAMMATVASFRAAKTVTNVETAGRLAALGYYMIDKALPYKTMDTPFITKGNPRFCTQYNNSETGENIGPILSGTSTWLALSIFEAFGICRSEGEMRFSPVLRTGSVGLSYRLDLDQDGTALTVEIKSENGAFRVGERTRFTLDGEQCDSAIPIPKDGTSHKLMIVL